MVVVGAAVVPAVVAGITNVVDVVLLVVDVELKVLLDFVLLVDGMTNVLVSSVVVFKVVVAMVVVVGAVVETVDGVTENVACQLYTALLVLLLLSTAK